MTRIDIVYDGHPYSTGTDNFSDLKARILDAATGGTPFWLTVNEGAGTVKAVDLLITSHSQISVAEIIPD